MKNDIFISIVGTLKKVPAMIGRDENGYPVVMMHVHVDNYKGAIPVKLWRGWAAECLKERKVGDIVQVDGILKRRAYEGARGVKYDDFFLEPTNRPTAMDKIPEDDLFISVVGTLKRNPEIIRYDSEGQPVVGLRVGIKTYGGIMYAKLMRGWAQEVLDACRVGDTIKLNGVLERHHYTENGVVYENPTLLPTEEPENWQKEEI